MQITSGDVPIEISGVTLELPPNVGLPVDTHEVDWTDSLPPDSDIEKVTGKTVKGYSKKDKSNWLNDAIARKLREQQSNPPAPDEAFQQINEYFIDQEGSVDAGLDRVESLLSGGRGKLIDRSIAQGNYEIAKNRIDKLNGLTDQEKQDLKDVLDGKA